MVLLTDASEVAQWREYQKSRRRRGELNSDDQDGPNLYRNGNLYNQRVRMAEAALRVLERDGETNKKQYSHEQEEDAHGTQDAHAEAELKALGLVRKVTRN